MSKKIKILFTIPNFDTAGSGRVVVDLVRNLNKEKFDPHICCTHTKGNYFKEVEKLGVPIHVMPFYTSYKPYFSLPYKIWKIARFFKKYQFNVIHSWHWSSDFTEPLAAKIARIPFVYTKKAMGWGNKAWHWRTMLSAKVIAINKDMIAEFLYPYLDKVVYMPLGVDTEFFKPLSKRNSLPNGLSFQPNDSVIVSVANLAPVKGIEILLQAILELDDLRIKVLVVGNNQNDYGILLKKKFKASNIFFIDKQIDIRPYLAVADIFVIPTKNEGRREGLPIAPLEAMASRRVVIGSRISGIKDILEDFQNCLFDPGDINQLKILLKEFIDKPQELAEIGFKMRHHVESKFSLSNMIHEHELLYENFLK